MTSLGVHDAPPPLSPATPSTIGHDEVARLLRSPASRCSADYDPSFAQTSAEFNIDSSDNDDDYKHDGDSGPGRREAYEMRETKRRPRHSDSEEDGAGSEDTDEEESEGEQQQRQQQHQQQYSPEEESAVVAKHDRHLVIFVALLYMLSFLDRSNIGNARVAGMDADLQQSTMPRADGWYEWALTAFYLSYIGFEWMALLWRVVPAHVYTALIVFGWGLAASLQAAVTSYRGLVALRFLLGIAEAGFAGIPYYLSFFFRPDELAFRTAVFISAAPLATSFASSLAWLILRLSGGGPVAPWRLLFLIEGLPSVLVAAVAWRLIPDSPQTARYLTSRERQIAQLRLRLSPRLRLQLLPDHGGGGGGRGPGAADDVLGVLADPAAWITAAMLFLANLAYASLPVFLPSILAGMGHTALAAQALSAPPHLLAFAVVLVAAALSDRLRTRATPIALHALASSGSYTVLALSGPLGLPDWARYCAVFPAASGFFAVVALTIAWSVNNQAGPGRRGGGFALLQTVGQLGPLIGTRLYPDADAPLYARGMGVCAVAMLAVACLAVLLRRILARRNLRLEEGCARPQDGRGHVGARKGKFSYML